MISEQYYEVLALKKHIEDAKYLIEVARDTAKKIKGDGKNFYDFIKQRFKTDDKINCTLETFMSLIQDNIRLMAQYDNLISECIKEYLNDTTVNLSEFTLSFYHKKAEQTATMLGKSYLEFYTDFLDYTWRQNKNK